MVDRWFIILSLVINLIDGHTYFRRNDNCSCYMKNNYHIIHSNTYQYIIARYYPSYHGLSNCSYTTIISMYRIIQWRVYCIWVTHGTTMGDTIASCYWLSMGSNSKSWAVIPTMVDHDSKLLSQRAIPREINDQLITIN